MALAIFDLDNTLIGGDSDHAWGQYLCDRGHVDPIEYSSKNDWFYEQYLLGKLDIQAWLSFSLGPLRGRELAVLERWHADFMEGYIEPIMLPAATDLLNSHRKQGDYLLIITATNHFVTAPIAERLGVDAILASDAEIIEGRYTGRGSGVPCYQHGKVVRLDNWLEETGHTTQGSYFYSDSHNDLPLLEIVDTPVAVDPDPTLEAHARERGWTIMSLR